MLFALVWLIGGFTMINRFGEHSDRSLASPVHSAHSPHSGRQPKRRRSGHHPEVALHRPLRDRHPDPPVVLTLQYALLARRRIDARHPRPRRAHGAGRRERIRRHGERHGRVIYFTSGLHCPGSSSLVIDYVSLLTRVIQST